MSEFVLNFSAEEERLKRCLIRWLKIRAEENGTQLSTIEQLAIDIDKSVLLRRLCDGLEPTSEPPPIEYAAPYHFALECGRREVNDVYHHTDLASELGPLGDYLVIAQHYWVIDRILGEKDYICRYWINRYPRLLKPEFSSTRWRVKFLRDDGKGLGVYSEWWEVTPYVTQSS